MHITLFFVCTLAVFSAGHDTKPNLLDSLVKFIEKLLDTLFRLLAGSKPLKPRQENQVISIMGKIAAKYAHECKAAKKKVLFSIQNAMKKFQESDRRDLARAKACMKKTPCCAKVREDIENIEIKVDTGYGTCKKQALGDIDANLAMLNSCEEDVATKVKNTLKGNNKALKVEIQAIVDESGKAATCCRTSAAEADDKLAECINGEVERGQIRRLMHSKPECFDTKRG